MIRVDVFTYTSIVIDFKLAVIMKEILSPVVL